MGGLGEYGRKWFSWFKTTTTGSSNLSQLGARLSKVLVSYRARKSFCTKSRCLFLHSPARRAGASRDSLILKSSSFNGTTKHTCQVCTINYHSSVKHGSQKFLRDVRNGYLPLPNTAAPVLGTQRPLTHLHRVSMHDGTVAHPAVICCEISVGRWITSTCNFPKVRTNPDSIKTLVNYNGMFYSGNPVSC